VQYTKNGWQNRNRIKTATGPQWLTVPVHARLGMPIDAVTVAGAQPWRARHRRAIEHAYAGARYLGTHRAALDRFYDASWERLTPLALASAEWLARTIGVTPPARRASALGPLPSEPTERLIAICRAVGADTYLAGRDGATYMDGARFEAEGIRVLYQAYTHPEYAQLHGDFTPFLSGLDLLLTHGDEALAILRSGDSWLPQPLRDAAPEPV
jgi:hypothetical protein